MLVDASATTNATMAQLNAMRARLPASQCWPATVVHTSSGIATQPPREPDKYDAYPPSRNAASLIAASAKGGRRPRVIDTIDRKPSSNAVSPNGIGLVNELPSRSCKIQTAG